MSTNEDKSPECQICKKSAERMDTLRKVMVNNHTKLRNIMDAIYEAERKLNRATQAMDMISKDLHYHGYIAKGHRVNPTCQEILEGYAVVSNESTNQSCDNCNTQKKSLDDLAQILLDNYIRLIDITVDFNRAEKYMVVAKNSLYIVTNLLHDYGFNTKLEKFITDINGGN
ncbi:hypothetical protein TorRG33x02_241610 [Trema orientale]|uniref:Uncharacterized protein n=1 Tax=Trema orientale TaxID=63057 RepID=A0A2P5DUL6_TREOI|nr:hypothetical protein TorRG33x02_241610 [Trema orientale]